MQRHAHALELGSQLRCLRHLLPITVAVTPDHFARATFIRFALPATLVLQSGWLEHAVRS